MILCTTGGVPPPGEGVLLMGGAFSRGDASSWGGASSSGGGASCRGVCSWGGAWSWWGVPGGGPPVTTTAVGGTHPTGMHSCYRLNSDTNLLNLLT